MTRTTGTCGVFIAGLLESAHSSILGSMRVLQEGGRENYQTFIPIRLVYAPVDIDCGGEA